MLFHLPQIRNNVRVDFNQASAAGFIADSEIDQWANEAYYKYALMLMKAAQGYFETTALLDIVAGAETISLPSNFTANEISLLKAVIVEKVLSSSRVPLRYRKRYSEENSTSGSGGSGETYLPTYDFRGSSLVLEPTPDTSENDAIRVVFQGVPPRLRCGTAATGGAATITFDSGADPRNDYYNNARIYIYSGTGAGQIRTISDYVGSTKIATVSASWTTPPDGTSVFSTLIHDDFPEIFHELIPFYATKKAFLKERSLNQKSAYDGSALKELEAQFVQFIDERTQARKFVQPFEIY